tara:strand:- start:1729 stop:1890 length:162 start_codon:yes stop_codon:yes gene_type:complete
MTYPVLCYGLENMGHIYAIQMVYDCDFPAHIRNQANQGICYLEENQYRVSEIL